MTAWGRTGRVTLEGMNGLPKIFVDGETIGNADVGCWLYEPDISHPDWGARVTRGDDCYIRDHLPSLDAAVMWVLRRAAPDVWRAERPVVAKVYQKKRRGRLTEWRGDVPVSGGEYLLSHVGALALGEFQHILDSADASARGEYARQVTP